MFNIKRIASRFVCATLATCLTICSITVSTTSVLADDKKEKVSWPKGPDLYGTAACLIEASTGTVLYEKNPHDKMYPASITKILTALVTIENSGLDEDVTFSEDCIKSLSYDDANMAMEPGEILSVEDCLYGLMLKSANEVATALAEHVSGSTEEFAKLMNERAKQAGATDSHFVNANGLHNDDHYITAYDMCMITRAAISNPVFLNISGTTSYTIGASNYKKPFDVYNRHKMLFKENGFYYDGVLGGKTGFTDQAGTTLVTYARRNGMTLISVVLHSNGYNVYNDTKLLFDYGFDNFNLVNVANNETKFLHDDVNFTDNLSSPFGAIDSTSLYVDTGSNVVLPKDIDWKKVSSSFSYDKNNQTNEDGNYVIATINYSLGDKDIGTADVLVDKVSLSDDSSSSSNHTVSQKNSNKFKIPSIKINAKIVKSIIIIILIIGIITAIILLIRRKQRQLQEIRARKRRRNY